jgi:hypothetical protein
VAAVTREELDRLRELYVAIGDRQPRPRPEVAKELRQAMAEITDHIALIAEVELLNALLGETAIMSARKIAEVDRLTARVQEAERLLRDLESQAKRCEECGAYNKAYEDPGGECWVIHHAPDCALAKWLEGK